MYTITSTPITNNKLTSIQKDYKELLARRDVIIESAVYRLGQIDKEIQTLYNEQIKLEEMLDDIRVANMYKLAP